jgi:hypothetical protein
MMNTLTHTLSEKHINTTVKKKYDKSKMSGTFVVGLSKLGTTIRRRRFTRDLGKCLRR